MTPHSKKNGSPLIITPIFLCMDYLYMKVQRSKVYMISNCQNIVFVKEMVQSNFCSDFQKLFLLPMFEV